MKKLALILLIMAGNITAYLDIIVHNNTGNTVEVFQKKVLSNTTATIRIAPGYPTGIMKKLFPGYKINFTLYDPSIANVTTNFTHTFTPAKGFGSMPKVESYLIKNIQEFDNDPNLTSPTQAASSRTYTLTQQKGSKTVDIQRS